MSLRQKKRNRFRAKHLTDLSMTPLIDVALTLLVIFMVTSPLVHNAIKVTLPRGNAQEETAKRDDLIVYIDKNNDIFINTEKTEKDNLIAQLKKIIGEDKEKTVYVKADTTISYGTVLELVDNIKYIGGIHYVALATQKPTQTTSSVV